LWADITSQCFVLSLLCCAGASSAPINAEFIKVHYKAAVLKLHPDKHVHSDEATQRRTAERFRRLQVAYEVLKDAEKRRAYDQGRLVH
jgi:DnaJ-class molecular chaperone